MKKHLFLFWITLSVFGVDAQIYNDNSYSQDVGTVCSSVNTTEIRKFKIFIKEFYYDSEDGSYEILNKFSSTFHPMNDSVWKETCFHVEMAGDYYFIIKDSSIQEYDFINNCKSNNTGFMKCAEAKDSLGFKVVDYYNTNYYHLDTLWKHSIIKTDANGKVLLKNEYTYNKKHNYNQYSVTHDSLGYKVTDYFYNDSMYKDSNLTHTVLKYDTIGSKLYYKNISISNKRIYYTLFLDNDSSTIFKSLNYYDGKLNSLSISQEYKPVYLNNHDFTVKLVEKNINMKPKPSYVISYNTKTKHFIYDKHNRLTSIETIETNDETKQVVSRTILKIRYYNRKRLFGLW
jgi:hypothetical protein